MTAPDHAIDAPQQPTIRVGVLGARGRMGATVCDAVRAHPATELVAMVDDGDPVERCAEAGAQVVVDFTVAAAARTNLPVLAAAGIHAVVGTTGFTDADLDSLRAAFTRSHCLVAPNFAIGAVLLMRFAELAAPFFETAEVVELHHDAKADAPSGTAMLTVQRMADASASWAPDPTRHELVPGARGGTGPAGIHVHSLRLRGLVAHQEVLLGTTGQLLTIRHDSLDRTSFMPGVVLAVQHVMGAAPGLTVGLDGVLGL